MALLDVIGVAKTFTLHTQGGARIAVLRDVSFRVEAGEALALAGRSGAGKSTLMRMLYGNYGCDAGSILVAHDGRPIDMARAEPRTVLDVRRRTMGYISQFLRVIPRVPTLDVVAEPLRTRGVAIEDAKARAATLLERLRIPERLWSLSPVTFSGGEQQRVNVARGLAASYPILLLDEPTASLDAGNKEIVMDLIREARAAGSAVIGIFHDEEVRAALCDRVLDVALFRQSTP